MELLAGYQPYVTCRNAEIVVSRKGKRSLGQVGLVVGAGAITLFMFGKPYLGVDVGRRGDVVVKRSTGLFHRSVVEIEGPIEQLALRKIPFARGSWRIRIYTEDADRILACLN